MKYGKILWQKFFAHLYEENFARNYRIGGITMNNIAGGFMNTNLGNVQIDKDVIAKYAGSSAVECFGIVGMATINVKDGFAKLLKRESLTHGVEVAVTEDGKITIDLHIIVSYGVSISAVTDNLISNVKYKVEEFAGLPVERISVFVEGVRVID